MIVIDNFNKKQTARVFNTKIRENATIVQAPVTCLDIISYDPRCNGAIDYKEFLDELSDRLEMHGK